MPGPLVLALYLLLDFPFICTASARGFFSVPYFILLSVNIAMMILNFFTRLHTYLSFTPNIAVAQNRIHIKRKNPLPPPPLNKVELIDWSRF